MTKNHILQIRCTTVERQALDLLKDRFCYDELSQFIRDFPSIVERTQVNPLYNELYHLLRADKKFPLKQWNILFFLYAHKARDLCVTNLANYIKCIPAELAEDLHKLIDCGLIRAVKDNKGITRYKMTVAGLTTAQQIFALYLQFNRPEQMIETQEIDSSEPAEEDTNYTTVADGC
jgi:DNA-binding MarR family transcriptional regulator